jgi:hypothetical protein
VACDLVIVLRNYKTERVFGSAVPAPEILGHISSWLASAEKKARENGVCCSFGVEIHQVDAECDHERQKAPGEGRARKQHG